MSIFTACEKGDIDKVRQLIDAGGIDLEATEQFPLLIGEDSDLVWEVKGKIGDVLTPLVIAVKYNHQNIIELLLEKGANINTTKGKLTPLMMAAKKGHYDLCKFLIEKGADVNGNVDNDDDDDVDDDDADDDAGSWVSTFARFDNSTALILACQNNHSEIIKLLVDNGAEVNVKNKGGFTPFMSSDDIEIRKFLLEKGAEINAQNFSGMTALMFSAVGTSKLKKYMSKEEKEELAEKVKMCKLLIENGADTKIKNDRGETALSIAKMYKFDEVIHLLDNTTGGASAAASAGAATGGASSTGAKTTKKKK
jgi:ankyrin repeat protein